MIASAPADGGRAAFRFERDWDGRAYLAQQYAAYPFHVTRPLYLEPEWPALATLCLQSLSGGLFQGDRLQVQTTLGRGTAVQLTTQSATKAHGMERDHAAQAVELTLGPEAYLEYLSDPLILFPGARVISTLAVWLAQNACAVVRESFLHHDPGGSRTPLFDSLLSEVAISDSDGALLARDRQRIDRPGAWPEVRALLAAYPAQGVLYVCTASMPPALIDCLRAILCRAEGCYGGVSALPNGCGAYLRLLAPDGETLRRALDDACAAAREILTGQPVTARWRK